jgi:ankyrin repeat protein
MLDSNGRSPLFYACYGNQLKCVEFLLDYYRLTTTTNRCNSSNNNSSYSNSSTSSSTSTTQLEDQMNEEDLLNKVLIDFNGDTCLHAACSSGSLQVISFLLRKKANPDIPNQIGMTCIHVASNVQVLQLLLEQIQQPDCLALDFYGRVPLCYFCLTGDVQSVIFLIEKHPDFVDFADDEGNTPLHFAVMTNQVEIIKILSIYLDEMAYFLPNQNGFNAFELANNLQQQEAIDFLINFYPKEE